MFKSEAEMKEAVVGWMESQNLMVRSEFTTPWGVCDLVGVFFNREHVSRRLELRQIQAITSITRASLLLSIPDVETKKTIALSKLIEQCAPIVSAEAVYKEIEKLVEDNFVVHTGAERLQKINGWMPLQERIVGVELKLHRVEEALTQARNNLGFCDESYIALPLAGALRVSETPARRDEFREFGVGLLGVTPYSCEPLILCQRASRPENAVIQFCCVEKFWRTSVKGN